jgi:glutamate formiminotransferase/formiminotetrahydrofolate cyclodeaminase
MALVECVPNFSEGCNQKVIDAIKDAIAAVEGVSLLDCDPGRSTNRTVITFVGEPEAAVEGAFAGIATAANLIDMRNHKGAHPRMGATDVCPFVPVSGVDMDFCARLAEKLGKRVGEELGIPVYLYAHAAKSADRKSLSDIRQGEYEGLADKMQNGFKPDFGPREFNPQAGATVIGARPFLIAYNVNLNTKSAKLANEIAMTIREGGRAKRDQNGEIVKDGQGKPVKVAGTLKECKAVGWYIDEYQQAQVSINLTDYRQTSMHHAFDEVCRLADQLGLRVTGSEIVGLVPLAPMLDAGRHYLAKQGRCLGVSDAELITIASKSLGLSDLTPFNAKEKIIEYRVRQDGPLVSMTVKNFVDEIASESPAPGGGSVAALLAGLSTGLTAMVANLTYGKKGFEPSFELMNDIAVRAQKLKDQFVLAIDEDTQAFNKILQARRLPKASVDEIAARNKALLEANKYATMVPFSVLQKCQLALELAESVANSGNPNSLSDAGVAVACAVAAADSAYFNVVTNLSGIEDAQFVAEMRSQADVINAGMCQQAMAIREGIVATLK